MDTQRNLEAAIKSTATAASPNLGVAWGQPPSACRAIAWALACNSQAVGEAEPTQIGTNERPEQERNR